MNLPFSHFSLKAKESNAVSKAWEIDIQLDENRLTKFFALTILNKGPENNDRVLDELSDRIMETIKYQQHLLEGNRVSVTTEDFFEQCLQKINAEISSFLRDISVALPIHSWAIIIGMLAPETNEKRKQFFTSRFGEVTGWLLNSAQLDTKKLINIFDEPDSLPPTQMPQKFFRNILNSSLPVNDQLLFCTPNLLNYISLSDIKKTLSTLSVAASLKHFENQIDFRPNDTIVSSMTIKLAPFPVIEQAIVSDDKHNAEHSMSNLINTQSETEKLLGNSAGLGLSKLGSILTNFSKTLKNKLLPPENELVPSQGGQQKKTIVTKIISFIVKIVDVSFSLIASVITRFSGQTSSRSARKKKSLELLSTNQTITRVSIFKKKFARAFHPLKRLVGQSQWSAIFKKPLTYIVIIGLVVIIALAGSWRSSSNQKAADLASARDLLVSVTENITRIDSHLIVGREADAVSLLQQSQEMLASAALTEELAEESDRLKNELEQRQRRVRKEILVTNASATISGLSASLGSAPVSITGFENQIFILSENPHKLAQIALQDNSNQVIDITTDASALTHSQAISASEIMLVNKNTLTVINTGGENGVTSTANTQAELFGAEFFNNRLYTLAPADNKLLRSNRAPNYSVLNSWLDDDSVDLSDARDLAIDGSIYVLKPDGITQLLKGRAANPGINLAAIDPALSDAQKIWAVADSNRVYILEPSRLIVFEKTGRFVAQYVVEGQSDFKDFVIDETNNKAYILVADELIQFELQ